MSKVSDRYQRLSELANVKICDIDWHNRWKQWNTQYPQWAYGNQNSMRATYYRANSRLEGKRKPKTKKGGSDGKS